MQPAPSRSLFWLAALLLAAAPAAHATGFEFGGELLVELQSDNLYSTDDGADAEFTDTYTTTEGEFSPARRRVLRQHAAGARADAGPRRAGRPGDRHRPELRERGRKPDLPGSRRVRRSADPRLRVRRPAPARRQVRPALLARLRRRARRVRHGHVRGHHRDRRDGRRGLRLRLRRRGAPLHPVRQRVHGRHQRPQRLHGQQARADARAGRRPGQHRQHGILRAGARHRTGGSARASGRGADDDRLPAGRGRRAP